MSDKELRVIQAMLHRGGGFVQALAVAMRQADPVNFLILKRAFPDIWRQYERHAASLGLQQKKANTLDAAYGG